MFPAGASGAIIAAAVSRKRRRIIAAFRAKGATSPDAALTLDGLGLSRSVLLDIQRLRGVIVEAGNDRLYLDDARAQQVDRARRVVVPLAMIAVIALVFVVLWWTERT